MKTALLKDGIREIKNSYKRFISILLIVLLGVGFFAGLRAASPDMKHTLDIYFDQLNVMDIQVLSTLGLTNNDITAIKEVEGVKEVAGAFQTDATVSVEEKEVVVKLESISGNINKLELVEGRMPENENECIVEPAFLTGTGHSIGDTISIEVEDIKNDEGEDEKVLKQSKVQIVGTAKSPIYISTERGSTKLGSGKINYYMYVPKDNVNVDMYTNIYITVAGAKELSTTSSKYEDVVQEVTNRLENISEERQEARYNELYDTASQKIKDAENELNKEKEKAEKELKDAQKEIDDGKNKLEEGQKELEENRKVANNSFAEAEQKIKDAEDELSKQEKSFETSKKKANAQIEEYEEQLSTLKQTQTQLNNVNKNLETLNETKKQLEKTIENAIDEEKEKLQVQLNEVNTQIQKLQITISVIKTELQNQGINDISDTIDKIENGIVTAKEQLTDGEKQISDAKKQIKASKQELSSQKSSTYYQLNQAEREIEDAKQELEDGEKELEDARKEFDKEIEEAENKLLDAKEDLKEIERPEWYVLTREENVGYASYVQDTDRVASLADVFPIVFFLVAAPISLTSMSRMVEEQRVEIGTLKALGYNKEQIARKYMVYATIATIAGGITGVFIGFKLIPKLVADMYGMVYDVPEVILQFNWDIAIFGMLAAIISTVGATLYTCVKILMQKPATLMRPKSPKAGKRVLLERISIIWNHLSFTSKVTARNLFRYKKRFLMTIIGVCGCTSLIIAGFGLRDAIANMIPNQFGDINKYNISISLKEEKYGEDLENLQKDILENEEIVNTIGANVQSVKIIKNDNNQSIQLIVPEDTNKLKNFIELRDRRNPEEKYNLDNTGVIVSEKLSELLDIKEGDDIELENSDGDRRNVKVSKITENYIMHYIYMSPELYNTKFDDRIESNMIYALTTDLTEEQENQLGERLLNDGDNISGVSFTSASEDMFATVMENMDMVVWILIIAAGLLALVVLYNLLNANISERTRELATIKVLGFYDKEVYSYIGRETIILTIIGMLIGLIGGNVLTMYVLKTCELDITMFDPNIELLSYVWGILITVFFAIIVNVITYFSLKKIDMIESLKSVE